jgi:hypothetical protein
MSETREQRERINAAKNEIQRRIQQMVSSGQHDLAAVKAALKEIMEGWR